MARILLQISTTDLALDDRINRLVTSHGGRKAGMTKGKIVAIAIRNLEKTVPGGDSPPAEIPSADAPAGEDIL